MSWTSTMLTITVLEYEQPGDLQSWKYVNPLVRRINAFREALQAQ